MLIFPSTYGMYATLARFNLGMKYEINNIGDTGGFSDGMLEFVCGQAQ